MTVQVPSYSDLLWPTLQAAIALGGSASIAELDAAVVEREQLTPEQQSVLLSGGPQTVIQNRLAWARTYLKGMGLFANSTRGVWSVTPEGQAATQEDLEPLRAAFAAERKSGRKRSKKKGGGEQSDVGNEIDQVEAEAEEKWKDELLSTLLEVSSVAFERLAQRLLRESGFSSVKVTGKSGDGGIDGLGIYQLNLLTFPVFFQCKRYKGSVGSGAVRDFRGAMAGRGDKGLLITTGTFTSDARAEAKRDGAPPIDLIDGDRLCDLLKENAIGITTTKRVVEDVKVEAEYFKAL
ncbi:restriction endonuclease [Mycobacterium sp. 852014-50255_SCH5639931]|uniref:restriction endonuclease n=1 Tax=Mycobacterium sp. 852014-50255_SCH5639931 TaxID=1834112 RepID=UPI000801E5ED|nr:restriction endonuclease [Mycobacterium sp. 852014-50255_SCH5639931]OBB62887.1 restriction endonuclease [Mycobacterium sp. 852014-50255_SCH5639931]